MTGHSLSTCLDTAWSGLPTGRSDPDQRAWRSFRPGITEMDPSAPGGPNNGHALTKGKALSNAMRSGKRLLAGAAAGALAAGALAFVGAGTVSAALEVDASVGPVRGGTYGTIPAAQLAFTGTAVPAIGLDDTLNVVLITAPSLSSAVYFDDSTGTTLDDSATLAQNDAVIGGADGLFGQVSATDDDSTVRFRVNDAGTYAWAMGDGDDTVNVSLTTAGAPATLTLAPASQTVAVGAKADLVASLTDASGNLTQPFNLDNVTFATTRGSLNFSGLVAGSSFYLGALPLEFTGAGSAGTATITATPGGTISALGAKTATVTESGTVSDDTVTSMTVECTSGCWNAETGDNTGEWSSQISSGQFTTVKVVIDDTTANTTSAPIRLQIETTAGSVTADGQTTAAGGSAAYVNVTPSGGTASLDLALGGGARFNGATITLTQVLANNAVLGGTSKMTIVPVVPTIGVVTITPSGKLITKIGESTTAAVTIDDSLGDPLASQFIGVFGTSSGGASALLDSATTDSSGKASLTFACTTCTTTGSTKTFYFQTALGTTPTAQLLVTYTTGGGVTSFTVTPATGSTITTGGTAPTVLPLVGIPGYRQANGQLGSQSAVSWDTTSTATFKGNGLPTASSYTSVRVNSATTYTVSSSDAGVCLAAGTSALSTTQLWSKDCTTGSINASYDDSVFMWSTKTGSFTYTVTSGGLSASGSVVVINDSDDAYNMALSPTSQNLGRGAIGTVSLLVTDMFGNDVTTADDTGAVKLTAAGEVLFAGYASTIAKQTATTGKALVTIIAGNSAGNGSITGAVPTGDTAPAWATTYTPPTGMTAPTTSAAATVTVAGDATKSIVITGERGNVNGKPGVMVDGLTTGFAEGDKMVPYIKFPGQTSYSEGSARPTVDDAGEFYWQRKTGKKIYIYFANEDGTVKSERIIIQAK